MEPSAVTHEHLGYLAARLAWGRLLPGLALLIVGISQPVATIDGERRDDPETGLSLTALVGRRDTLENGSAAATFAVLAIIAVALLGIVAVYGLAHRTEDLRRATLVIAGVSLAVTLVLLGVISSAQPLGDDAGTTELSAQGLVPLLFGSLAVLVGAFRAKEPRRLYTRTAPDWPYPR